VIVFPSLWWCTTPSINRRCLPGNLRDHLAQHPPGGHSGCPPRPSEWEHVPDHRGDRSNRGARRRPSGRIYRGSECPVRRGRLQLIRRTLDRVLAHSQATASFNLRGTGTGSPPAGKSAPTRRGCLRSFRTWPPAARGQVDPRGCQPRGRGPRQRGSRLPARR